jgi:hypothetical protein
MLLARSPVQNSSTASIDANFQIKVLQEDKIDLLARISQMVSRTELLAARAEASSRQAEVQVLEQQIIKQRQTMDVLNERINGLQEENSKLHIAMEVRTREPHAHFRCVDLTE